MYCARLSKQARKHSPRRIPLNRRLNSSASTSWWEERGESESRRKERNNEARAGRRGREYIPDPSGIEKGPVILEKRASSIIPYVGCINISFLPIKDTRNYGAFGQKHVRHFCRVDTTRRPRPERGVEGCQGVRVHGRHRQGMFHRQSRRKRASRAACGCVTRRDPRIRVRGTFPAAKTEPEKRRDDDPSQKRVSRRNVTRSQATCHACRVCVVHRNINRNGETATSRESRPERGFRIYGYHFWQMTWHYRRGGRSEGSRLTARHHKY